MDENTLEKLGFIPFSDLIWADDELFENEWFDSTEPEETDFWSEAFENDLLLLKTGV